MRFATSDQRRRRTSASTLDRCMSRSPGEMSNASSSASTSCSSDRSLDRRARHCLREDDPDVALARTSLSADVDAGSPAVSSRPHRARLAASSNDAALPSGSRPLRRREYPSAHSAPARSVAVAVVVVVATSEDDDGAG